METQLLKENVMLEQPTGRGSSSAVVEGEITLPGGLREETHVLHAGGMAVVDRAESGQDRAVLSGKVLFHVLYTQGAPDQVQVVEATADFIHQCDLPGAQLRGRVQASARVEHVDATVQGGRLTMRAIVQMEATGMNPTPVEVVSGLNAPGGAESVTQEITLRRTVGSGQTEALLREELELPEALKIRETLCADARVQLGEITGGQGRIGVEGTVLLEAVHASELPEKPLAITRHQIPFTQSVEISGENGELLGGRVVVRDVAVASQDMGDGTKTLRAEVLLAIQGWVDVQESMTVLSDAFTLSGSELEWERRQMTIRTGETHAETAESGKAMLLLPDGTPPVQTVLCAFATPVVTAQECTGSRVNVEGMLEITLLYMSPGSPAPVTVHQEAPFRTSFAALCSPDGSITLTAGETEAVPITSDRVELRYVLRLTCDATEVQRVNLVTDARETASEPPEEGLTLWFVQPGETWWTIARRFRVRQEALRQLNPDMPEELTPGMSVVVWRKTAA